MSDPEPETRPLSERLFEKNLVTLPWIAFVGSLFVFVGMPIAKAVVVCLVKGTDAYFHQGIRILRSARPLHFTDGSLVPELPYFIVNLALFFVIVGGLSLLLLQMVKLYERRSEKMVHDGR